MRRFLYFFLVILLCLFQSCDTTKDEWAGDGEPVGEMTFDGITFRETGYTRSIFAPSAKDNYYGGLFITQRDGIIRIGYLTKGMINEDKSITATFNNISVDNTWEEPFSGGIIHYSQGQGRYKIVLTLYRKNKQEFYEAKSADFFVNNVTIHSSNEFGTDYYFRIDYEMEMIDSVGVSHQVTGWAIHGPNDNR